MSYIDELGTAAKAAEAKMTLVGTKDKNAALKAISEALLNNKELIIKENKRDIENAKINGMTESLIDRLTLTEARIDGMSEGVLQVMALKAPIGEIIGGEELPNGLCIEQKRVPLGVIGIIFESRPNVTADAFGLCFKSGNAVILKGGSDAIHSNIAITTVIRNALKDMKCDENAIQLIEDTNRETTKKFMQLNQYVDVFHIL